MESLSKFDSIEPLHNEIGIWRIKNFFKLDILNYIEKNILPNKFEKSEYHLQNDKPYFSEFVFHSVNTEFIKILMEDDDLMNALSRETNNPSFIGCIPRFYKFYPKKESGFGWHGDNQQGRTLGFSVNLSKDPYEGGKFIIRRTDDHSIFAEYQNLGYGDAIFFNIRENLVHCVTEVTGTAERIACAGWYIV